ncbi:hypothetical protein HYALB_00003235 [Hymenoscyphus albidus]|uniref:Uncharacterized protein n=1 Tax=Hymenoscyphus albidus TaxID=595503 RepID=A0A9N9LYF1_9HELO|nr:hypothetical protein HYALB_00003235 [Hymenoscyphus albidus]
MKFTIIATLCIAAVSAVSIPAAIEKRCFADGQKCLASNDCCSNYCGFPNGSQANGLRCTYK